MFSATAQKHCLIVDDSDVIRRVLKHMLAALRIEATEAVDGQDAIERCRDRMPDAILLDWSMPNLSGLDFLAFLRRQPGGDKPVVLYCPTESDPADIARALSAGADDILVKPFDRQDLQQKLVSAGVI